MLLLKTTKVEQNGYYFAEDILKYIFSKENYHILISVS